MRLGKSQREKAVKRVASVAAFNADGLLLFGKRTDSGKWTLPGGHLEPGEEPLEGARRELEEESGLKGQDFEYLGRGLGGPKDDIIVYAYRCKVDDGDPDGSADPDEECDEWRWVEPDDIPTGIAENLHSPKNVTLRLLGLQDGGVDEPDEEQVEKSFEDIRKKEEGTTEAIPVMHFSNVPGLRILDPKYQGTGLAGVERNRSSRTPRVYFYTRPGKPEAQIQGGSKYVYHGELPKGTKLYDMGADPHGLLDAKYVQTKHGLEYRPADLDTVEKKLKRMGYHGYHNYGVESALAYFHPLKVRPGDVTKKSEESLEKGFGTAMALAGALSMGGAQPPQLPKPPAHEVAQKVGFQNWNQEGLHPDLFPIAHLESSWGKNQAHATNKKGAFHTAFGPLGFKPVTAHEEYLKSKTMKGSYPGLESPEQFLKTFSTDPKFYNLLASAHFARLKGRHGGAKQAAYAWRWGTGATTKATPEQISNDAYVQKYTDMNLDQKTGQPIVPAPAPVLKKTAASDKSELNKSEDPLEPMLSHEDPRERIMALRSKLVTPYHLRIALQDADPEVRIAAAKHPMMTGPLIEEALKHHDLKTRKAALSRPDLQPQHLELAIWDPDLQTIAAQHPALSEDQRQMLASANNTPEGLRSQLLSKSVGYVTYPKLGQPKVHSEPMARPADQHAEWLFTHDKVNRLGVQGAVSYNRLERKPLSDEKRRFSASVNANSASLPASVAHETQHSVFAKLRQEYGNEAGHRIVASTLAALDPKDHEHLQKLTNWKVQGRYSPIQEPEERIAYLQNYLQDPQWRKSAHKSMRIHMNQDAERVSYRWARDIWRKLREAAANLTPEHVSVETRKAEEDISEWVLRRSEDTSVGSHVHEDMLGLTPKTDAHLAAAKFLTHMEPDENAFRQALREGDDLLDAALASVGLPPTEEHRKTLKAILVLQSHTGMKKAEKTHEVTALMPDGVDVAEGVRRGFGASTEEELHLGGKHSAGTMLVQDPETGQMYLLKPGSGGQSPALGAKEEPANQSRREAAFWHVAKRWGVGQRLPRADLLLIDGKEVATLHMLPFDWENLEKLKFKDPGLPHKALEKYRQTGELHKWAIMDYVLGNPDRHGQNLMVGPQKDGYPVALIDHGSAFAGHSFDPVVDKNSFIPYYLRAWKADSWNQLDLEQRLSAMPTVNREVDQQLKEWLQGIHADDLEAILFRHGINPQPSLDRLAKVKMLLAAPNLSAAVNKLWLMP